MPSSTYPAYQPDFGQIVDDNGYVMRNPVLVPITWDMDPAQPTFDAFVDALGESTYWQTIAGDYGVGAASSGATNHVHLPGAPPTMLSETMDANSDLAKLVAANAGTNWPAPTKDTIYAFFIPPGTTLVLPSATGSGPPSDACGQGIGGYHAAVAATADGQNDIAYAVVAGCSSVSGASPEQLGTLSMSHELIETATDPFGSDKENFGWFGFDGAHFAFEYFSELQAENADACEFFRDAAFLGDQSLPYVLQRIWSNSSALAGHNPCVPVPSGPYFNVTPLDLTNVLVTLPASITGRGTFQQQTKGVRILEGGVGTFTVGFYSDAPTTGTWTLTATVGNPLLRNSGADFLAKLNPASVTATIDHPMGQNGDQAQITVTVTTAGAAFKGELLTLISNLAGVRHYMPIWIAGE